SDGAMSLLEPPPDEQRRILDHVADLVIRHGAAIGDRPVTGGADRRTILDRLSGFDPEAPADPAEVVDRLVALLGDGMVHTGHPRYFGLFNPAPSFMGIVGELVAAAFNP